MTYISQGPWTEAERQEAIVKQLEAWLRAGHVFTEADWLTLAALFTEPVRP